MNAIYVLASITILGVTGIILIFFKPLWWLGWALVAPMGLCALMGLLAALITIASFIINKIRRVAR